QLAARRGDEEALGEIVLGWPAAGAALAAAVLAAVGVQRQPLDVAVVADRDDVDLLGQQILVAELVHRRSADVRAALVAVLVAQLLQVLANHVADVALAAEQSFVAEDVLAQTVVLLDDLVALQRGQLAKL